MTDYTLSGALIFEGINLLEELAALSGSLLADAQITGTIVATAEFEGGINFGIGATDQAGLGNEFLDVSPEFDGTLRLTLASFDFVNRRVGTVAEFAGSLTYTDDATGEVHSEIGAFPVTAHVEFSGALLLEAAISGELDATSALLGAIAAEFFIGNSDSAGNEFLDVAPTLTGEPDTDILQSPPYVHFDGVDDYLYVEDTTDAALNGGAAFSVAFIFDPEIVNTGASGTVLGKHDPTSTNHGWRVEWDDSTGLVTVFFASTLDGSNTVQRVSATPLRTRSAVVVTYDGTDINIYVTGIGLDNGSQSGTAGSMVSNAAEFAIGAHDTASGATNFFRGAVNGIWIWDVELSGAEAADVDPYGQFDVPQFANLQVAWSPWDIHSTGFNAFFVHWSDVVGTRPLKPPAGAATKPLVLPSALTEVMLLSDRWDTDFQNVAGLYGADQNLASNYPLSSDPDDASEDGKWRLFSPPTQQDAPEIVSGYRDFRSDITIFVRIRNPTAFSVDITVVELLGLRLVYETLTGLLFLFDGDGGTPTRYQYGVNFDFGDGRRALFALRYNSVTGAFSLHHNNYKVLPTASSSTGSPASGTGLVLCDAADYGEAFVVASCLPDILVNQILNTFAGDVRSFDLGAPHWRLAPRRTPVSDLIWGAILVPSNVAFPQEGGTEPDPVYAALPARGTLELAGQPNDGDEFVIGDGEGTTRTFEFDSGGGVGGAAIAVTIGGTVAVTLDNLVAAVNASPLNITASARTDVDTTGDGLPNAAYTTLTHGTVPTDPFDFSTEVAIVVNINVSGNLLAQGMARPLHSVERYELVQRSLFDAYTINLGDDFWPYTDAPYIVTEITTEDSGGGEIPPFVNPLPTIVSVTADIAHGVVAIANAGPTDAGDVRSWWEVEMVTGSTETLIRIDEQDNNFSQSHNHIDTFTIPLGLNFDGKRIRFVIQSQVDPDQIWASLFFRMEGENFNNGETEVIIIPAPGQAEPPPQVDLSISLEEQQFVVEEESATRRALLRVSNRSRYKLTRAFTNSKHNPRLPGRNLAGFEYGLLSVLDDFTEAGSNYQIHRVRQQDIGFLDLLAVRFYGAGYEEFWWAIAYVNGIIDPEVEMSVGQRLVIPSREAVTTFIARKPGAAQGGG